MSVEVFNFNENDTQIEHRAMTPVEQAEYDLAALGFAVKNLASHRPEVLAQVRQVEPISGVTVGVNATLRGLMNALTRVQVEVSGRTR